MILSASRVSADHVRRGRPRGKSVSKSNPAFERLYDISRDGQHFLGFVDAAQTQSGASATQQIHVILNWFEELKARVPTK